MSGSQNIIVNMELNISAPASLLPESLERELYRFAHGALIETLDDILDNVRVDGDVELDSLTLDIEVDGDGDVFNKIIESLRKLLVSKLDSAVFKKQSAPVTAMLANIYRQYLPMDKSSNLERRFDELAERWNQEHHDQKFSPLNFSESIIKTMQAENPQLDIQQIAYVVYQKILQMKNPTRNPQKNQDRHANSSTNSTNAFVSENGIHEVVDSGLVLLSPYLPALFERMGCIKKNAFISDESRKKAVAVLKYAAFGTYKEPPHKAAIINLLCGLPVTPVFYVEDLPKISDSEKELVDSLLKAVIANWKAVGQMSPDGLRGSYFVRSGKIEPAGGANVLTIEKKTYDILLDKLPWGFTVIKHPWMSKILNVKWR